MLPRGLSPTLCWQRESLNLCYSHERGVVRAVLSGVMVTGDAAVQELNRRHRGIDAPTDVLAFAAADDPAEPFVDASEESRYLGDIAISLERAAAQAADAGHPVGAELQLLVVHGVLHLLGFDDQSAGHRARMWAAQSEALDALGLDINPPL